MAELTKQPNEAKLNEVENATAQTNEAENVTAQTQPETTGATPGVSPTVKTQAELIAEANKYGINTDGLDTMVAHVFNEYVRPKLTQQITTAIAERMGAVYTDINTQLFEIREGAIAGIIKLCKDNGITSLTLMLTDNGLEAKRTLRNITQTGDSERKSRAPKYVITNGVQTYDSISDMLHTLDPDTTGKNINGAGVINKLKKLVNLNEYNVINQDDQNSEPFAVWAKLNVSNCPTI